MATTRQPVPASQYTQLKGTTERLPTEGRSVFGHRLVLREGRSETGGPPPPSYVQHKPPQRDYNAVPRVDHGTDAIEGCGN